MTAASLRDLRLRVVGLRKQIKKKKKTPCLTSVRFSVGRQQRPSFSSVNFKRLEFQGA